MELGLRSVNELSISPFALRVNGKIRSPARGQVGPGPIQETRDQERRRPRRPN